MKYFHIANLVTIIFMYNCAKSKTCSKHKNESNCEFLPTLQQQTITFHVFKFQTHKPTSKLCSIYWDIYKG